MRALALRALTVVAVSQLLQGCGGETGTNPQSFTPGECTGSVTIAVNNPLNPTFSWTPDCLLGRLIVEEGPEEQWGTETPGDNVYHTPIVYGVHPPGSVELQDPLPLVAGHTYRVSVYRWISVAPESLQLLGEKFFTP